MAQIGVAGTADVSASSGETGRQQASDTSMAKRVEEALRKRESEHRDEDAMLSAIPLWLTSMRMDRSPPVRFEASSGGGPRSGEEVARVKRSDTTSVDAMEEGEKSGRRLRAEPSVARAHEHSPAGDDVTTSATKPHPDALAIASASKLHAADASVQRGDAQSPMVDDVAAVDVGARASSMSGTASDTSQGRNADQRSKRRNGDGTQLNAATTALPGHTLGPHPGARHWAGAPTPQGQTTPRAPMHPQSSATGAGRRAITGGDGMRYAFGSWGRGHFVNVQVVQVDGRKGFVLGASDAIVQRRLSAALPDTEDARSEGPSRRIGVRAIEAIEQARSATDEDTEC